MHSRIKTPTVSEETALASKTRPDKKPIHNGTPAATTKRTPGALKVPLNILAALGVIAFLYVAQTVILPILLALVGAMVLKPIVEWMRRRHVPRAVGAAILLGGFICLIGTGFVELSQPAMKWINNAPQQLAQLKERAEKIIPTEKFKQAMDALNQVSAGPKDGKTPALELKNPSSPAKAINWTVGLLAGIIETVILLYMFLVLGDALVDKILDGTDAEEKRRALKISGEVQRGISNYLFTISLINISFGILVGAGLYFLGVPNAVLWGLLAAVLNYILYFGPIAGIFIVGIVGLLTNDAFPQSLLPAVWYLLLHFAEADFITPVLLGRHFTISPLVIFIFLLFGVLLWGMLGALLAVPLLISLKVLCQRVPSLEFANRYI